MRSVPRSLAIGSAVMLTGVFVFVLLARALTQGSLLIRFDQSVSDALRANLAPRALQVFAALTHLADTATLTVLCVVGTLVLVATMVLAFTVGISRVVLRVHFASDVAAGFASGSAWLALCVTSFELMRWWRACRATDGLST